MTKYYMLSMSNKRMHGYLNTTRYAWYIVSMLWQGNPLGMMRMSPSQMAHACI